MFVRSANKITLRPAMPNSASSGSSQVRHLPISRPSAAGAVPGGGVAVETIEAPVRPPGRIDHGVDECLVAAYAVLADDVAVARRDLDRLLEVLQGEGGGVAKAVVGLRRPLREARVRQMTLDARRGVPVAALEPAAVLVVHDVAVHARAGVGGEIGEAVRVAEEHGRFVRAGRVPDPLDLRRSLEVDRGAVDVSGAVARRDAEGQYEQRGGESDRASHAISLERGYCLLRKRGPSGFSTRTPGVPTNRCAAASGTTARPRRATLRSSPTALIQATPTPSGSAMRPSASTTSRRESDATSGVCSTPSNTLRCQLRIFVCHSPVLVGPALSR